MKFLDKGTFLSEDTDVFVITDKHVTSLKLKISILMTKNCLDIEDVFKFKLVRARPSLAG